MQFTTKTGSSEDWQSTSLLTQLKEANEKIVNLLVKLGKKKAECEGLRLNYGKLKGSYDNLLTILSSINLPQFDRDLDRPLNEYQRRSTCFSKMEVTSREICNLRRQNYEFKSIIAE